MPAVRGFVRSAIGRPVLKVNIWGEGREAAPPSLSRRWLELGGLMLSNKFKLSADERPFWPQQLFDHVNIHLREWNVQTFFGKPPVNHI